MNTSLDSIIQEAVHLYQEGCNNLDENPLRAHALAEQAQQLLPPNGLSPPLMLVRARILMLLSRCDRKEEQYPSAIAYTTEAIHLFEHTTEVEERILAMALLSGDYVRTEEYQRVLEVLLPALALAQQVGNRKLEGQIQGNIGIAYCFFGNHQKAVETMQLSLAIAEELGHYNGIAFMLMNIGNAHVSAGNLLLAFKRYIQGLEIAEQHIGKETKTSAAFLMNIAAAFQRMGEYDQALEYHLHSLAIREKLGLHHGIAVSCDNIGQLYSVHGKHDTAQHYVMRAIAIYKQLQFYIAQAESLAKLAVIAALAGDNELALQYCQQSLDIPLDKNNQQRISAYAYHAMGNVHTARGNYKQALHYLRKARTLYSNSHEIINTVVVHRDMGAVCTKQKRFTAALKLLDTALKIARNLHEEKTELVQVLQRLAELHELMGNSTQALAYFKAFRDMEKSIFNEKSDYKVQTLTILHHVEEAQKESKILQLQNQQLQNDLVTHAMHLAQRTKSLRKTKRDIAAIGNGAVRNAYREMQTMVKKLERILAAENRGTTENKTTPLQTIHHYLSTTGETALRNTLRDIEKVVQELQDDLVDKTSWQGFEQQFRKIHGQFLDFLASQFPQLSPTELKVCALIRINMSSKEISRILNIAPRSVDTYRSHIRQKMDIPSEQSLPEFMALIAKKI